MEKEYTLDERIGRLWDRETVTMLLNRRNYLDIAEEREKELRTLWVQEPNHQATASLAYNNGFYVGMDEIRRHYITEHDAAMAEYLRGEKTGFARCNTATTPLVYIADDGKTARYLGYRLGFVSTPRSDSEADTYLDFGRIFADLIREGDTWRIWHLVLEHDHTVTAGEDYAQLPPMDTNDPLYAAFGTPTVERNVHDPLFGWEYTYADMPTPYDTFDGKKSYGPEGDLGKPYYKRERR